MEKEVIDFSSSFMIFRLDTEYVNPKSVSHAPPFSVNNARINHECIATLKDKRTSKKEIHYLGASCKTERVGVDSDIWTEPNADFVPVFSKNHYLNIKTFEHAQIEIPLYPPKLGTQSSRQWGSIDENFSSVKQIVNKIPGKVINKIDAILDSTFEGNKLNAITTIENENYIYSLEYPIKTMNVNEKDKIFQTDTGPVLFPNLNKKFDDIFRDIEMAYIAFNRFDYAEMIVRKEKELNSKIKVFHYHEKYNLEVNNTIITPIQKNVK